MIEKFKKKIPWWARIFFKIILARLPVPYGLWKNLRLFQHGDMNQPSRALENFLEHAKTGDVIDVSAATPKFKAKEGSFSVLELGPGDALFSAIISNSLGGSRCWLVDSGAYAVTDMSAYKEFCAFLQEKNYRLYFNIDVIQVDDFLRQCGGVYLTEGIHSLAKIPSNSLDYFFSNAVLEHIPRQEFASLAKELFRLLKPNGVSVHRVDLRDHLGGGLNNLRFSEKIWEGSLFKKSGFYTNRIRFSEMLNFFRAAGFHCSCSRIIRWERSPIERRSLDVQFSELLDDDLLVSSFDLLLRKVIPHINLI
jgi:SAM-dependent methyltransferase